MTRHTLALALFPAAPGLLAQGSRRTDRATPEQRKLQISAEVLQRLNGLSSRPELLTQESRSLAQKVSVLLERSRQAPAGSHSLDRLESAMDDLLDASEDIVESRSERGTRQGNRDRQSDSDEARRSTARELERATSASSRGTTPRASRRKPTPRTMVSWPVACTSCASRVRRFRFPGSAGSLRCLAKSYRRP